MAVASAAVAASIAVPALMRPVQLDGRVLVDGEQRVALLEEMILVDERADEARSGEAVLQRRRGGGGRLRVRRADARRRRSEVKGQGLGPRRSPPARGSIAAATCRATTKPGPMM